MQAKQELKDLTLNGLMEYKGQTVFMADFKLMPTLVTAEENMQIFNYLNASKVKEGHINMEMFNMIPVVLSVFYPDRIKAFMDLTADDEDQRQKIDKLRVKLVDAKGIDVTKKLNKMDKGVEKTDISMANQLFTHINLPTDASNLKQYLANISRQYKPGEKSKIDK